MLSYRTPEEFAERFDAAPEIIDGRVRVRRRGLSRRLRRALRRAHRRRPRSCACPNRSTCIASIPPTSRVPTTVVAVEEDRLVPLADAVALVEAPARRRAQLHVLRSHYGHDAFLKEAERIAAILSARVPTATRLR